MPATQAKTSPATSLQQTRKRLHRSNTGLQARLISSAIIFRPASTFSMILSVAYANALLLVLPVIFKTREKVMAWDNENASFFQSPIQFSIGNFQSGQPEPQKERPFRLMNMKINSVEQSAKLLNRPFCLVLIIGSYHFFA